MSLFSAPPTLSKLIPNVGPAIECNPATISQNHEVVFIDSGVDKLEVLLQGVLPGVEAHLLGSGQDPVVQITEILQAMSSAGNNVQRVHIVSHGSPGCLHLGDTELSWKNIDRYSEQLKTWFVPHSEFSTLNSPFSLLLYGCNVAVGDAGAEFLEKLHRYTGAGIAASKDITGHANQGGNWQLSAHLGEVDAKTVFVTEVTESYPSVLNSILELQPQWPKPSLASTSFSSLAWGDMDGDDDLDLVISGFNSGLQPITKLYTNDGGTLTEDTSANLEGVGLGSLAWGDVDGDGDLDLVISGQKNSGEQPIAKLYINNGGTLTEDTSTSLEGVGLGSLAWGDVDGDGDLDLVISGVNIISVQTGSDQPITKLYINNGGTLTEDTSDTSTNLEDVGLSALAWGDVDGDGDLDLVISGLGGGQITTKLYINNGGTLTEDTSANLEGVALGDLAWGDVDGDGDLDLVISGQDSSLQQFITKLYINNGGTLTEETSANLEGVLRSSLAWGDVDGDNDLDLVISGQKSPNGPPITKLYTNNGGTLTEDTSANLEDIGSGALAWGDVDGDNDLDLIISGQNSSDQPTTKLYTNDNGTLTTPENPGIALGSLAWGDMDDDNDLDLVISGLDSSGQPITKLYTNDGGTLTEDTSANLEGVGSGSLAWGDVDGDNDLDLVISGLGSSGQPITKLYTNDGGTLTEDTSANNLEGVANSSLAWGDVDGDNDLDLVISGQNSSQPITKLYINNGGTLTEDTSANNLEGVANSSLAWGDVDGDNDLDLVISGQNSSFQPITKLYINNGGTLTDETSANLEGVGSGSLAWGDVDGDDDLDLVISGQNSSFQPITKLYINNGGTLTEETSANLEGVANSSLVWGDVDSDDDLDLVISGRDSGGQSITKVYTNESGTLTEDTSTSTSLEGVALSSLALGDVDGDNDLDFVVSGLNSDLGPLLLLYRNTSKDGLVLDRSSGLPAAQPLTGELTSALLTPITEAKQLEITRLGVANTLQLQLDQVGITQISEISIFSFNPTDNSRTSLATFTLLESGQLPTDFAQVFTLDNRQISSGQVLEFEITENGVTRTAVLSASEDDTALLNFGEGTVLRIQPTDETDTTNLLMDDAATIDLGKPANVQGGTINLSFTVFREASFDDTVGLYRSDFEDGGLTDPITGAVLRPGDAGYKEAALARQLDTKLTGQNGQVTSFTAAMEAGGFLSSFLIADGSDAATQQVYFSHAGANDGGNDHVKMLGSNTFGYEDMAGLGDRDFNDIVVQFSVI